jgi:hypothetical protein
MFVAGSVAFFTRQGRFGTRQSRFGIRLGLFEYEQEGRNLVNNVSFKDEWTT